MRFKKSLVLAAAALMVLGITANAQGDLIAHWNFNSPTWTGSRVPGTSGSPTSFTANSGTGTLDMTAWTGLIASNVSDPLNQNAVSPDPAGNALYFVSAAGNGSSVTFSTDLTGYMDPVLSYVTATGTNGFTFQQWAYSTDGVNFTNFGLDAGAPNATYIVSTVDMTGESALTNAATAFFRVTFTGAGTSTGNNRIDNFQINASTVPPPIPEPGTLGLLGLAMVGVVARRRRK